MTEAALHEAEGYVQVKPLGPTPIKGLTEPMPVYEVVGAGAARTRLQAAAARGLTRFVGRDAEVEQLQQALEQAARGRGQIIAVMGDPGSASRDSSTSSFTRIGPKAGSSSNPTRCRTAKQRRIFRWSSC